METNGGKVTDAIFVAGTFKTPGMLRCFIEAICHTEPSEKEGEQSPTKSEAGWKDKHGNAANKTLSVESKKREENIPANRCNCTSNSEEPDDDDWMPDRSIVQGNTLINLYYGMRNGKRVVVKREVLPLDGEDAESDTKGLESSTCGYRYIEQADFHKPAFFLRYDRLGYICAIMNKKYSIRRFCRW